MIDRSAIETAVSAGLVKATRDGSLTLYNYAESCVWERGWNETTLACRGLILHDDGRVVARPFRKFFNLHEHSAEEFAGFGIPELADKLDGSLVIVFFDRDSERWRAVTRGCWDNPQTRFANAWLGSRPFGGDADFTYLFELVAPWNRIVLFYAQEEMVLLGVIQNATGRDLSYAETARDAASLGVRAVSSVVRDFRDVDLSDPAVRDREGYVARFPNGFRVKLKFAQYLYMHKTMTGLSVKDIWEHLSKGTTPPLDGVPDEFMAWHAGEVAKLRAAHDAVADGIDDIWAARPWQDMPRKEVAALWQPWPSHVKAALFKRLDGRSFDDVIWKSVKPATHETFRVEAVS